MGKRHGGRGRVSAIIVALLWAQAVSAAPLVLSCQAVAGVAGKLAAPICDAVASVLSETEPARMVTRDSAGPDSAEQIEVTVLAADKQGLTAQLAWRSGGASGSSPPLTLSVTDAILAPHMYEQLAVALLTESDWPK